MDTSFIVRTFRIIIILSASVGFLSPESISAQQAPKFDIDSSEIGTIVVKETFWGTFAQYMPANASDILILVHGYPWPDGSRTMSQLADHVTEYAQRWKPFADEQQLLLLIPAFGSNEFLGYRDLFGTHIDADMFVNFLVGSLCACCPKEEVLDIYNKLFSYFSNNEGYSMQAPKMEKIIKAINVDEIVVTNNYEKHCGGG